MPMTGLDSETSEGRAVLLASPRRWIVFPQTFEDCIEFLLSLGDKNLCCWNMDYDAGAMLKFLPPGLLERLYQLGRWTWETRLRSWSVAGKLSLHYVPRKFLKIRAGSKTIVIYDLAQFFHMSLDRAAKEFLHKQKKDPGIEWGEMEAALKDSRRGQIIDYCRFDAQLCEELAEVTKQKFEAIQIPFERPVSCASLSYRVFREHLDFKLPRPINEQARESFRGGMIECLRAGYFKKAWYIDLRSAYPAAIAELKSPPKIWLPIEGGKVRNDAGYAAVDCTIHIPRNFFKGWLPYVPVRKSLLFYPVGRWRLMLDLYTFKKIRESGFLNTVHGGIQGIDYENRRPFRKTVQSLYRERAKDSQKKWAVKIILNSLFGKFAEAIGYKLPACPIEDVQDLSKLKLAFEARERFTNHTNFFMAAEVTARTRWRLIEDLSPSNVISYATDGVFLKRHPGKLDYGPHLGQWSPPEEVRDLVVVGSGVYCYKQNGKTETRFRGFQSGLDLYELLDRRAHTVEINLTRNQKLGASLMTGRWELFNVIREEERVLNVNFDRKRKWEKQWTARDLLKKSFESLPWLLVEGAKQ